MSESNPMAGLEDTPDVMTVEQALKYMTLISASTFQRLRRDGQGPKFGLVGNRVCFRRTDLDAWYTKYQSTLFTNTKSLGRGRPKADTKTQKAPAAKASKKSPRTADEMLS